MNFEEANKVVHKVEDQWHYSIMMEKGFEAITKEQVGFIRRYKYVKNDHEVVCITGASSDRWEDNKGNYGFWSSLEKI